MPKKKTPDQAAHKAAKERKQQGKNVRHAFSRDHLAEAEIASREDFNPAGDTQGHVVEDDPLLRYKELGFSEAYSLVRVVEVIKGRHYRIEVFQSASGGNAAYHAHAYRVEQPARDVTTGERIVTLVSLGSESENTPEKALASALHFLTS